MTHTENKDTYYFDINKIEPHLSIQYLRSNCMGYVDGGNYKLPDI